MKEKTTT